MASRLVGKYEFAANEGVDKYLQDLYVGLVFRKVQDVARPAVAIHYDSKTGEWIYRNFSVFNQHELRFKLGVPVQDETFDARECITTAQLVKGKLIFQQICKIDPGNAVMTFEKTNDGLLKISNTCNNFTCSQYFTVSGKESKKEKIEGESAKDLGLPTEFVEGFMKLDVSGDASTNGNTSEQGGTDSISTLDQNDLQLSGESGLASHNGENPNN